MNARDTKAENRSISSAIRSRRGMAELQFDRGL